MFTSNQFDSYCFDWDLRKFLESLRGIRLDYILSSDNSMDHYAKMVENFCFAIELNFCSIVRVNLMAIQIWISSFFFMNSYSTDLHRKFEEEII